MPAARAEEARARMLDLFPQGFEEVEQSDGVELVAYTDASGEERLWHAFGPAVAADVPDGWEDGWRRFHQPVRVGRLWVGPPWEQRPSDPDVLPVVIDPGRAFGTGAHPTTQLCLELLQEQERGSLLDVGCGSGVVGITAALLGFEPVCCIDVEEAAVEATTANAAANRAAVEARRVDALVDELPASALVVANVTLAAVDAVAPRLPAPRLISSGYLASESPAPHGWQRLDRRELQGWAADLLARA